MPLLIGLKIGLLHYAMNRWIHTVFVADSSRYKFTIESTCKSLSTVKAVELIKWKC